MSWFSFLFFHLLCSGVFGVTEKCHFVNGPPRLNESASIMSEHCNGDVDGSKAGNQDLTILIWT